MMFKWRHNFVPRKLLRSSSKAAGGSGRKTVISITLAIAIAELVSTLLVARAQASSSSSSSFGGMSLEQNSIGDVSAFMADPDFDDELARTMNLPGERAVSNEPPQQQQFSEEASKQVSPQPSITTTTTFDDHQISIWPGNSEEEPNQLSHKETNDFGNQPDSSEHQFISVLNNQSNVIFNDPGMRNTKLADQRAETTTIIKSDAIGFNDGLVTPTNREPQQPVTSRPQTEQGDQTAANNLATKSQHKRRKKKRKKAKNATLKGEKKVVHSYKKVPKVLIRTNAANRTSGGSMITYSIKHPVVRYMPSASMGNHGIFLADNQIRLVKGVPIVDSIQSNQLLRPLSTPTTQPLIWPKIMTSVEDFSGNSVYAHNTLGPFDLGQGKPPLASIYQQKYVQQPMAMLANGDSSGETATSASNTVATSMAPNLKDDDGDDEADGPEDGDDDMDNDIIDGPKNQHENTLQQQQQTTTGRPNVKLDDVEGDNKLVTRSQTTRQVAQTTTTSTTTSGEPEANKSGKDAHESKPSTATEASEINQKEAPRITINTNPNNNNKQSKTPAQQATKTQQHPVDSHQQTSVNEHELLVGPFKSESEAPDTITLAGIVYQKSGSSSSLVEAPKQPKYQPPAHNNHQLFEAFNNDNLSVGGSTTSASLYGNLMPQQQQQQARQVLVTSGLSGKVPAGILEKYWPYLNVYPQQQQPQYSPSQQQQQQQQQVRLYQGNQVSDQLLSSGNILLGSIASKGNEDSSDPTSGAHQITLISPSNTLRLTTSSYPTRDSLSGILTGNEVQAARPIVTKTGSSLYDDLTGSGTILTYGNSLASLLDSTAGSPTSSLNKATPGGGIISSLRASNSANVGGDHHYLGSSSSPTGSSSQSSSSALASSSLATGTSELSYASESKHKEKVAPIVIVQKDVKPVKYHLLRAYLKLRRLMRPFEATYVFPNDSSGILRRQNHSPNKQQQQQLRSRGGGQLANLRRRSLGMRRPLDTWQLAPNTSKGFSQRLGGRPCGHKLFSTREGKENSPADCSNETPSTQNGSS